MKWSYLCGVAYFTVNLYWMYRFSLIGLVLTILMFSLFWLVAGLIIFKLKGMRYFWLYVPVVWTSIEWLRAIGPMRFPWAELGSSTTSFLPFANCAALVGMHGLTFIIVLITTVLFTAIADKKRMGYIKAGTILISVTIIGAIMMNISNVENGTKVTISAIQPSVSLFEKWDDEFIVHLMEIYTDLADKVPADTLLTVWPETAFAAGVFNYETDKTAFEAIRIKAGPGHYHLAGTSYDTDTASFNTLAFADAKGYYGLYNKIRLIPVAEYLPSQRLADQLENYYEINQLSPGTEHTVFTMNGVKFSGVICFESIFHDFFPAFIKNGAEFFVVSTNDGWFDGTLAPYQHLQFSRLRAIESGRYVVHCANSGISAFIDPNGKITASLGPLKRDVLSHFVYTRTAKTPYYYIRDYWLIPLLFTAMWLWRKERS